MADKTPSLLDALSKQEDLKQRGRQIEEEIESIQVTNATRGTATNEYSNKKEELRATLLSMNKNPKKIDAYLKKKFP